MPVVEFRTLVMDSKNDQYLVQPFNISASFSRDPIKLGLSIRKFIISSLEISFDSRNLDLVSNLMLLKTFINQYKQRRNTYCPFKLENSELKKRFNELRLNFLINKFRNSKGLFSNGPYRRNNIDSYLERRWKYELYYEIKILHLMEKECQIASQMIYQLDSKIKNYD
jgi:hypothetical protein